MKKTAAFAGAILMVLAVTLGALGAHALKPTLLLHQRVDAFELALRYHFYHALSLLVLGLSSVSFVGSAGKIFKVVLVAFLGGVAMFSGSLYVLSLSGHLATPLITPLGGLSFIVGWVLFAVAVLMARFDSSTG